MFNALKKISLGVIGFVVFANTGMSGLASTANQAMAAGYPPTGPAVAARVATESPGTHEAYWGETDDSMVVEMKALVPGTNLLTFFNLLERFTTAVIDRAELFDSEGNLLQAVDNPTGSLIRFDLSVNPVSIPSDGSWRKFYIRFTYDANLDGRYPDNTHVRVLLAGFQGYFIDPGNHRKPLQFIVLDEFNGPTFEAVLVTAPQEPPEFSVTTLDTPASQNVVMGVTDFDWMYAEIVNKTPESENISVSAVKIEDTLGDAEDDFGAIHNADIWADLDNNGSYETKVSNTEQFLDTGSLVETYSFSLTQNITVVSSVKIALRADLGGWDNAGNTHTIRVSEITAVGNDTGQNATGTYDGTGQTMTVIAGGTLSVTVDSSSPQANILIGGTTGATLAVFRLLPAQENQQLRKVTITDDGDDNTVETYYLYANRDDSGNIVTPYLVDTAFPVNGVAEFDQWGGNATVKMPRDAYTKIYIKADIAVIDGTLVLNGDTVKITIEDPSRDIESVGLESGSAISGDSSTSLDAEENPVYKTKPYVQTAADSPSGALVPSSSTLVAKFNFTADVAADISLRNSDGNQLIVKINTWINDYSGTSAVWLVDESTGQELDSVQYVNFGSGNTIAVTFNFDLNDLWVGAGTTRKVNVMVDTVQFEDTGDAIQVWLDDDNPANFSWGIGGSGDYATANFTFRGNIYAGVLVKA